MFSLKVAGKDGVQETVFKPGCRGGGVAGTGRAGHVGVGCKRAAPLPPRPPSAPPQVRQQQQPQPPLLLPAQPPSNQPAPIAAPALRQPPQQLPQPPPVIPMPAPTVHSFMSDQQLAAAAAALRGQHPGLLPHLPGFPGLPPLQPLQPSTRPNTLPPAMQQGKQQQPMHPGSARSSGEVAKRPQPSNMPPAQQQQQQQPHAVPQPAQPRGVPAAQQQQQQQQQQRPQAAPQRVPAAAGQGGRVVISLLDEDEL